VAWRQACASISNEARANLANGATAILTEIKVNEMHRGAIACRCGNEGMKFERNVNHEVFHQ
jgi:hypothetical protein